MFESLKETKHLPNARFVQLASKELASDNIILLKDTWYHELAEIHNDDSNLFCVTCNKEFCIHTGFCYSLPQAYQITKKAR